MAAYDREYRRPLHPLHAILLAFAMAFFFAAMLSDWAYYSTYQIQWSNFSEWLIVGGLVGGGFALVWALVDLIRSRRRGAILLYFLVLLATWALGFFNALVHSKDAWGSMPTGFYLSIVVAILALIAAWIGYSAPRAGDAR